MTRIGEKYRVHEGSGLDSGRVGVCVAYSTYYTSVDLREGRVKPFDGRKEAVLVDDEGNLFFMYKNRLDKVKEVVHE